MTVLDEILSAVRAGLERRMADVGLADLLALAETRDRRFDPARVAAALRGTDGVRVIAEVKRRGPAVGSLAPIGDPGALAAGYAAGGAAAVSVLTEPRYFGGSLDDLAAVRARVAVPVLRKDFIVDPYQLAEAAAHGADLVLLIVAALPRGQLESLLGAAGRLGLAALVEVHTETELARAVDAGAEIIGVNARDLSTLEVDRGTFTRLGPEIPAGTVAVAESGVRGPAEVREYAAAGADAVLVGSALVATANPADAVADLVRAGRKEPVR
jgi:indole-3-glycerol phosphate synthase